MPIFSKKIKFYVYEKFNCKYILACVMQLNLEKLNRAGDLPSYFFSIQVKSRKFF